MRIQDNHHHAYTEYSLVGIRHYLKLLWSVIDCKLRKGKSLTVHLPFEIQHGGYTSPFDDYLTGMNFILFGERLKKLFRVKLYWENAPWLNYGTWDLKYENTYWSRIPNTIDLCLDTGHLMLGCEDKKDFTDALTSVMGSFGLQIKHLHLSENDFIHDKHWHTQDILTPKLVEKITRGRTYIWEESS